MFFCGHPRFKLIELGSYDSAEANSDTALSDAYTLVKDKEKADVSFAADAGAEIEVQLLQGTSNLWGGWGTSIGIEFEMPFEPRRVILFLEFLS